MVSRIVLLCHGPAFLRSLLILLLLMPALPSRAMDEALFGVWGRTSGTCDEDMVITIARDGLSGMEFFCTAKRSKREKSGWRVQFACAEEGRDYALRVHWRLLKNGTLREVIDGKTREYKRCDRNAPASKTKPKTFAEQCVACYNEAFQLGRSVGGRCRPECLDVRMNCDEQTGMCKVAD